MKQQLIKQLIDLHKKSLNPSSKWYNQDLQDFTDNIYKKSEKELEEILFKRNCIAGNNKDFNKKLDKEEKLMLKSGMFNIGNMKPLNALD